MTKHPVKLTRERLLTLLQSSGIQSEEMRLSMCDWLLEPCEGYIHELEDENALLDLARTRAQKQSNVDMELRRKAEADEDTKLW